MEKIISYSLWGNNPKYIIGAKRNIELAKEYFPDWKVRIYLSENTEFEYGSDNLEIIRKKITQSFDGMFWRFESCDSDDIVIIRDLDDRLSDRHKFVVDQWLDSDKDLHIIRDHPNHLFPIMGGLWGCRNGILKGFSHKIENWKDKGVYASDQVFLANTIFSEIYLNRSIIHDPFHKNIGIEKNIDLERTNYEFLGDTFDENDVRNSDYWQIIKNSLA